ncbi:MAG: hypothetical protein LBS92_00515 [Candidatus Methanoplasma sp.]|jgi:hypothetical protein|nr:hypothetical protein [Candidatus Methanoplasma sp.]
MATENRQIDKFVRPSSICSKNRICVMFADYDAKCKKGPPPDIKGE